MNGISNDQDVMDYALNKANEDLLANSLKAETMNFIHNYLKSTFDWSDLSQEWRNHQFSYGEKSEVSAKSKHAIWAKNNAQEMEQLVEPARKFLLQLNRLFGAGDLDLKFIQERIHAAYDYFFVAMDKLVDEILWKIEEVKRIKKAKAFYEELAFLEEVQIKAVLRLMKTKLLIETIASGEEISKEKLTSIQIKQYKINKVDKIQTDFKSANVTLIEDDYDLERYTSKK